MVENRQKQHEYDALVELYEQQYASYRDDIGFYLRLADDYVSSDDAILELGAGTARVTQSLAQAGHRVVAVEPSKAMLLAGQGRLEQANLSHAVTYHHTNAQNIRLEAQFPLIIAPFNMLMHLLTLAEQDAALANIRQHLASGGVFACDLYNPQFGQMNVLRREPYWQALEDETQTLFVVQHHHPEAQQIESRYYLDTAVADGLLKRQVFSLLQRYYTHFELERALRQAGFSHVSLYGHFDKQRYSKVAPHLIAIAR